MRLRLSILTAALLCGAAAVSSAGAAAPTAASFALKPVLYDPALTATKSYFILAAKPGDVIRNKLRIVNTGGTSGTAYLYPVDATTGQTSGAVYLGRGKPRRDVGSWVTLARSKVTLAPGADAVVPFTIRVPTTARPGDHLGGIVAENAQLQSSSGKGALQIKISHLTIAAVQLQLPGRPVAKVAVTGVRAGGEHGYQYVYLHLKSTGNAMIKPVALLTVRNAAGRVVARRTFVLDTFLPGTAIDYPALLPRRALKPGDYTALVRVQSGAQTVVGYRKTQPAPFDVSGSFPFTVTSREQAKVFSGVAAVTAPTPAAKPKSSSKRNWKLVAAIAIVALLVVVLVLLLLRLRRRRRGKEGTPATPAPAGSPPTTPVAEPEPEPAVQANEEPGWAGLLAAYESQPRHQTTVVEVPEPADEPPVLTPVAVHGPVVAAAAAAALAPEPQPAPEPAPAPVLAAVPDPEPAPEPAPDPESAFELQAEPWFEPEPQVEEVAPEPWFEPEPQVEAEADPPVRPAAQPTTVIDPEALKAMIVEHDLAVADAYFRPDEPGREPTPDQATAVARPQASAPRFDADAGNLSSALVEASLIALAAVIATKLLRNPD